ncbi:MAG: hypothetical protein SGPRY_014419, partial [Prymnesium sp.]
WPPAMALVGPLALVLSAQAWLAEEAGVPSLARPSRLWSSSSLGASPLPPLHSTVEGRAGEVPRRIFTFWSDPHNLPEIVAACLARMKYYNPLWEVHLLYPNVPGVEPPPTQLSNACCGGFDDPTHVADWYRAAALARYGGVWLDSTAIINQPLERWANLKLQAVQVGTAPPSLARHGTDVHLSRRGGNGWGVVTRWRTGPSSCPTSRSSCRRGWVR